MACLCETKVNLKRVGIFCGIFVARFVVKRWEVLQKVA